MFVMEYLVILAGRLTHWAEGRNVDIWLVINKRRGGGTGANTVSGRYF